MRGERERAGSVRLSCRCVATRRVTVRRTVRDTVRVMIRAKDSFRLRARAEGKG